MIQRISASLILTSMLAVSGLAQATEISATIEFGDAEVSIIRTYYRDHDDYGSRGKKKAKPIPPGILKNLQRGKAMPPGIAKQVLPADLVGQLPAVPRGFERVIVGGKVLLIEVATQVIHDVLEDVLLN